VGRKALTIPSLIASLIGTLLLFYGLQITSLPNIQPYVGEMMRSSKWDRMAILTTWNFCKVNETDAQKTVYQWL